MEEYWGLKREGELCCLHSFLCRALFFVRLLLNVSFLPLTMGSTASPHPEHPVLHKSEGRRPAELL